MGLQSSGPSLKPMRFREGFAKLAGTLSAAALPACIFSILIGSIEAFVLAFLFSLAHAVVLGLPVAVVMQRSGQFLAFRMLVAGACVGLLPTALFFYPEGSEVLATYLKLVASAAALGAAGGIAYYWAHQAISPKA